MCDDNNAEQVYANVVGAILHQISVDKVEEPACGIFEEILVKNEKRGSRPSSMPCR